MVLKPFIFFTAQNDQVISMRDMRRNNSNILHYLLIVSAFSNPRYAGALSFTKHAADDFLSF